MIFSADETAGELTLVTQSGETVTLDIAVLDYPMWQEYNRLAAKSQKLQKSNPTDQEKAEQANTEIRSLVTQLEMMLPGLQPDMLRGFSLSKLSKILAYCVEQASKASADTRDPEEKKTESVERSRSYRSQGKASRSRRSTLAG